MTRTKQQELEQAQNLHLIRDERDLELENSYLHVFSVYDNGR